MEYGVNTLSVVPVRAEPSDKSELVTQLFFGECYELLQKEGKWLHIRIAADRYTGWIDLKQHTSVTETYFQEWQAE
ncbi:MAG: SH3 domain-containing protein, partial [Hymenobacteraceae bacterium]|nr:SH3 domain-containing protein [Hymenobacteraceae bacterium]MDX5396464.1 SH3 domain-containing protein [Hymenobacteraceae bacterium]MDX5512525.1 SH3 domain-containing protein [Hymenobacteraceae bacterium]